MPKLKPQDEITIDDNLSFEDAMEELESLVRGVDMNRIPLNEMISGYERGIQLHKVCQKRLDEARGRIEIIRKRSDEEADLEPFGDSADNASSVQPSNQKKSPPNVMTAPADHDDDQSTTLQNGELF